jgi:2-dehydro-3-deoxyphosphogluconate aldolase/(4S)-4-hydroxy-2-oxoglutarate aldolase
VTTTMTTSAAQAALLERFAAMRIVPVIVIDDPDDAVPLARALSDGGLPCAEVTLRTPRAMEALRRIASELPDMLI